MLASAASLLNLDITILDVGDDAPAKQVYAPRAPREHIDGSFSDSDKIRELAKHVDILTVEIEHVNVDVLEQIESSSSVKVHPSPQTIRVIQDKLAQKLHFQSQSLPVVQFLPVEATTESVGRAIAQLGLPLMLKSRTLAYDGRGNFVIRSADQIKEGLGALGNRSLYAERWAPFVKEVAVVVVRSAAGEILSYPAVETVHKDNICHLVFAPLRAASPDVAARARKIAEEAVVTLTGAGVYGVELFLLGDGELLINEVAPRPHNSGHYSIEACHTSQFENHLRAILSLPLGSTSLKVPSAAMLNLIGYSDNVNEIKLMTEAALALPGASVHLYGKAICRKGRKMGHITVVGSSDAVVRERLRPLLQTLPDATSASVDLYAPPPPEKGHSHPNPLVGIIMGSDSDLPVMLPAARILDAFQIPFELTIVSAHRTPDRMVQYARKAVSRGLRVIIAGAGGAAHLPGMVAALTSLPVIGVPVKGSTLDGVDSLHSIVQMPRGIPVATVAINNSTNAALLAVRILGSATESALITMDAYINGMKEEVLAKVEMLESVGWEEYTVKR
ncbi:Phosphoribosylaminoimidazole carboxylase [Cantharellus anzutake]|uniref:Phosphoribosylaminoimidazole carboxylase n=1 Tax=Cantharellus anzutake TaxID=1750568 RepID=UPI001903A796|nr:Phosphoribosylaminoimidazole carboxylase [Cantharellus anzutake]KAF8341287.1 Phosphoribosylaminoimidazole carboxylase [Cantharellus anzutake]